MGLIINIVLVCRLLKTSISFMYNPYGYNHIQHHQLPNYDNTYADSNEEYQSHYHHRNTRLRSEQARPCSGSRLSHRCRPKYSPPPFLPDFLPQFPLQMPEGFVAPFPSPLPSPDVIILPYPVPVMVVPTISPIPSEISIPPGGSTLTTASVAPQTTQLPPTELTPSSAQTISTTVSTTTISTTTSTIPPFITLRIDTTNQSKPAKRFKIMTIKTYRRKGYNLAPDLHFNGRLPKYGIVRIPENLAMSLMQKLNNENKARLRNQQGLFDLGNKREFRLRQ